MDGQNCKGQHRVKVDCAGVGEGSAPATFDPHALPGADRALQAAILADGVVTFDEYERAVLATMTCMEDRGLDVEGPHRSERRCVPFVDFAFGGAEADLAEADAIQEACALDHVSAVADTYAYQDRPSSEELTRQQELVVECLGRIGIAVGDDAGPERVDAALDAAGEEGGRCLGEVVDTMNAEARADR